LSRHCSKTSKVSARYTQITFGHTHISTTQQIYTYFNEAQVAMLPQWRM